LLKMSIQRLTSVGDAGKGYQGEAPGAVAARRACSLCLAFLNLKSFFVIPTGAAFFAAARRDQREAIPVGHLCTSCRLLAEKDDRLGACPTSDGSLLEIIPLLALTVAPALFPLSNVETPETGWKACPIQAARRRSKRRSRVCERVPACGRVLAAVTFSEARLVGEQVGWTRRVSQIPPALCRRAGSLNAGRPTVPSC
jgi:hypothetical protein